MTSEIKRQLSAVKTPIVLQGNLGAMACFGKIEHLKAGFDREFDQLYWQSQSSEQRFTAAWELAVDYHRQQGMRENEFRLQRSIITLQRFPD